MKGSRTPCWLEKDCLMKGTEAFKKIIPLLTDEPVIHANGFIAANLLTRRTGKEISI